MYRRLQNQDSHILVDPDSDLPPATNLLIEQIVVQKAIKPCKCNSTSHQRISHSDCPLNPKKISNSPANQIDFESYESSDINIEIISENINTG